MDPQRKRLQHKDTLNWRTPPSISPPSPCGPSSPQSPPPLVVRGKSLSLNRVGAPALLPIRETPAKELSKRGRKQRLLLSQAGNLALKRRETSPDFNKLEARLKPKRGPLPMRMRALPQSFWQEPKNIQNSSLSTEGTLSSLPPLFHNANNTSYDVSKVRPVTPPEEKYLPRPPKEPKLVITSPQEQLLKLFETVEEDKTKKFVIRRGRPRRVQSDLTPCQLPKLEEDPCMMTSLAEKLFPQLSLENNKQTPGANTSLSCVSVHDGDKSVTLPSLNVEQNYSQMLSEIVAHF
ncbi:uncharacterized protein [Pocillopora verrucosa]|uniref:Uncharacterized protein n=2 Tax=Pocillopora TaxID=46730 RepID=A0A3M6TQW7_POCDA|nr:uncharacterized protein LOC113674593 [Pocillopora damicornis]XP_058970480.1 uncharacterized protein LOC131796891 [Pocillopora verrucosa]RMX43729.1 hypothetical protein pdam_00006401 [Pocillopora damicornis]CAH3036398.1 unnamed protein product [Pocillopora meandrina]